MSKPNKFLAKVKDIASKFTASELAAALREKEDVIAVQVWTEEDIETQAEECGYSKDNAKRIAANVKGISHISDSLEDCSPQWDRVNDSIFYTAAELGIGTKDEEEHL